MNDRELSVERKLFQKSYRERHDGSTLYCESEWRGWQAGRASIAAPVQEPVAWAVFSDNGNLRIWFGKHKDALDWAESYGLGCNLSPLYTAPLQEQPQQPKQDHVHVAGGSNGRPTSVEEES